MTELALGLSAVQVWPGTFTGHSPRVVIVDAVSTDCLQTGEVADAWGVRGGVEVAGDDGGKRLAMAGVEVGERNGLSLTGRLGIKTPRGRRRDEQHVSFAGQRNRDRKAGPGDVHGVRES
jgi:hypothetical protein